MVAGAVASAVAGDWWLRPCEIMWTPRLWKVRKSELSFPVTTQSGYLGTQARQASQVPVSLPARRI